MTRRCMSVLFPRLSRPIRQSNRTQARTRTRTRTSNFRREASTVAVNLISVIRHQDAKYMGGRGASIVSSYYTKIPSNNNDNTNDNIYDINGLSAFTPFPCRNNLLMSRHAARSISSPPGCPVASMHPCIHASTHPRPSTGCPKTTPGRVTSDLTRIAGACQDGTWARGEQTFADTGTYRH